MGIFDFFKRKEKKCIKCGIWKEQVDNQNICSSCSSETKIIAEKAKIKSAEKFKKLKDVNLKITEIYRDFKKQIKETDDGTGESLNYWYDIVKKMASKYPLRDDYSFDIQIKERVFGNYDEYKRRDDLIDASDEHSKDFARMRIFSFGKIYSQLILLEKKINKLLSDNSIKKHKISVQLNNELAVAKSRTYGAIKYALSVNISKDKIKEWFPAFVDDKELIEGINPWDSLSDKYNFDNPSSTPQYELLEEEKDNIPDWYTGSINDEESIIKDEKTGKEIKLTGLERSIYDLTMMNNVLLENIHEGIESGEASEIILESPIYQNMMEQREQGKIWLKENNLEAYKVLFREPEEDNNPWTKNLEGENQSMLDIVSAHFDDYPLMPSYFIWLKEDENDNKLKKDGLSVNLENKFALIYLCVKIISPKFEYEDNDKKQSDYFMRMVNMYAPYDEFKKENALFKAKLDEGFRKDKAGNQYIERIIKNLSDYNKLVFVYTIYDLLYINIYLKEDGEMGFDKELVTGDPETQLFVSELLVEEGLFKDLKICNGIMYLRKKAKLQQIEMIESFGSDLDERGKDAVIYLLMNFILRKKNTSKAFAEYDKICSLINYDTNRIKFDEDGAPSFISEDDALDWLLNIDEASKNMFEMLVKMIITSNLHYSVKEQFYFNNLINKAELTGMHEDESVNDWLLSFCDTDKEDVLKDLFDKIKKYDEKNGE